MSSARRDGASVIEQLAAYAATESILYAVRSLETVHEVSVLPRRLCTDVR